MYIHFGKDTLCFSTLAAHQNYPRAFRKYICPWSTPKQTFQLGMLPFESKTHTHNTTHTKKTIEWGPKNEHKHVLAIHKDLCYNFKSQRVNVVFLAILIKKSLKRNLRLLYFPSGSKLSFSHWYQLSVWRLLNWCQMTLSMFSLWRYEGHLWRGKGKVFIGSTFH